MVGALHLIGLDPGLNRTGWAIVGYCNAQLTLFDARTVKTNGKTTTAERLVQLFDALIAVIQQHNPHTATVERNYISRNPVSPLQLSLAHGIVLFAPAKAGLTVTEYSPSTIKKSVVGYGHATKKHRYNIGYKHYYPPQKLL